MSYKQSLLDRVRGEPMNKTIEMTYSRSTKNTHTYVDDNSAAPIPVLHIQKSALPSNPVPTDIEVTIKVKS